MCCQEGRQRLKPFIKAGDRMIHEHPNGLQLDIEIISLEILTAHVRYLNPDKHPYGFRTGLVWRKHLLKNGG